MVFIYVDIYIYVYPTNLSLNSYPTALTAFLDLRLKLRFQLFLLGVNWPVSDQFAVPTGLGLKSVLHAHYGSSIQATTDVPGQQWAAGAQGEAMA